MKVLDKVDSFTIAEREDSFETVFVNTARAPALPYGMWMVTLTTKRVTHIAYVLAASSEEAICQVDQIPMDEGDCILAGKKAIESGEMTATAVRIPFHIRGWGLATF